MLALLGEMLGGNTINLSPKGSWGQQNWAIQGSNLLQIPGVDSLSLGKISQFGSHLYPIRLVKVDFRF